MALFGAGIGIDISDHHVRIARVSHNGDPSGLFELVLPHGLISDDKVVKPKSLKKELKRLIVEAGLEGLDDSSVILIPESRVYSTSFIVPKKQKKDEFEAHALSVAQKDIPIPFSQASVDIHKGSNVEDGVRISVNVVKEDIVKSLYNTFSVGNFNVSAIESNNAALNRLFKEYGAADFQIKDPNSLVMIVDIGHRWTNITLYDKMNTLVYSRSIALRTLSESGKGTPKKISKQMIQKICTAILDTLAFFKPLGLEIPFAVVAGVEGLQERICTYCSKRTKKCIIKRIGEMVVVADISVEDVHTYGAAIGAAYRAARERHFSKDHKIPFKNYV